MSMHEYYKSINDEFKALQNRITYLIGHTHHATTGGYQESLLRSFISKYLPDNIGVGRGFVVFKQREELARGNTRNDLAHNSNEIDILLYDKNRPVLYRDSSELILVEPHSVKGMIEVKKKLYNRSSGFNALGTVVSKLSCNAEKINQALGQDEKIFVGLFAYETEAFHNETLPVLQRYADQSMDKVVSHICLGEKDFIRFWQTDPLNNNANYNSWRAYQFEDNLAMGYFIYNLITHFNDVNTDIWFPTASKEIYCVGARSL